MSNDTFEGLQAASKVVALLVFLIGVATAWKFISYYVGGTEEGRIAADSLLSGPLATNFWVFEIIIGLVMPLFILVGSRMKSVQAMSTAGLLVLVGQFFQRFDLVTAGQQVPVFSGFNDLPTYFSYIPSTSEFLVTLGGIGVAGAGFLLGERFFGKAFSHSGHH
jgi:molybdopterin-containing oxidoreductase family membrane subunit